MEVVINLIETPQRSDFKADYKVNGDMLNVTIEDKTETFDFTGLQDGYAGSITSDILPLNPVVSAEKIGDIINVTVIRFYGENEKELFEDV